MLIEIWISLKSKLLNKIKYIIFISISPLFNTGKNTIWSVYGLTLNRFNVKCAGIKHFNMRAEERDLFRNVSITLWKKLDIFMSLNLMWIHTHLCSLSLCFLCFWNILFFKTKIRVVCYSPKYFPQKLCSYCLLYNGIRIKRTSKWISK